MDLCCFFTADESEKALIHVGPCCTVLGNTTKAIVSSFEFENWPSRVSGGGESPTATKALFILHLSGQRQKLLIFLLRLANHPPTDRNQRTYHTRHARVLLVECCCLVLFALLCYFLLYSMISFIYVATISLIESCSVGGHEFNPKKIFGLYWIPRGKIIFLVCYTISFLLTQRNFYANVSNLPPQSRSLSLSLHIAGTKRVCVWT